jgi:hypothetical protein
MKHWLRVLVSVALVLTSAVPVWAGRRGHGWSHPPGIRGFGSHTWLGVDVPDMRRQVLPGTSVTPQRMAPRVTASGAGIVSGRGRGEEITLRTHSVHVEPVQSKIITVDPSSRPHTVTSADGGTSAHPGSQTTGSLIIAVNAPVGSRPVVPKVIDVSPALVSRAHTAKVVVFTPSLHSRHHGRTVIGFLEGSQGPSFLLGSPCDLGVTVPESCAPVDSALLFVEATPEDAQIFLDGQLLGTAGQLAGQTVAVPAGPHRLEIVSPEAKPFSAQFTATPGIPTRIHVALGTQ